MIKIAPVTRPTVISVKKVKFSFPQLSVEAAWAEIGETEQGGLDVLRSRLLNLYLKTL